MSRFTVRLAMVALLAGAACPAAAQDLALSPPSRPPGAYRITPRWDTYVFSQGDSSAITETRTTSWANVFSMQADLGALVVRLAIPISYAETTTRATVLGVSTTSHDDQAELGNIGAEALANIDLGTPDQRLLIGGGLALPTATDQLPSDRSQIRGLLTRAVAWRSSFRNAAAWQEHSFTLWPTAEYRLSVPWVLFTAEVALPLFIPTNSRVGGPLLRGNVELMFTFDVTGAVRILDVVDVGASFLAWALPSGAGYEDAAGGRPDLGQTAITLFVRTDDALDAPIGGGFEMIFNLDEDWGPTGDDNRFWGAHIFLTAKIDA